MSGESQNNLYKVQKIIGTDDLSRTVSSTTGLSRQVVRHLILCACDAISDALATGDCVRIVNFGTFITYERSAMVARNMQTGEPVKIEQRRLVRFKASKNLIGRLRESDKKIDESSA